MPAPSQYRQTFSMIGSSAVRAASRVAKSDAKVFSAPTDLRIRSGRIGRSSPRPRHRPGGRSWRHGSEGGVADRLLAPIAPEIGVDHVALDRPGRTIATSMTRP